MIAGRGDRGTAALAATVIAWSIVVVASSFLPLVDLPQHVAAAQLLLALDRPEVRALYDATLFPQVNVLGLYVSAGLLAVLPEAAAVRVLLVVTLAALGWALLRLARACGAPAWSAAFAMLFAFHFNWMYGFLSFNLGIPLLLVLLARWAAALDAGAVERASERRVLYTDAILALALVLAHTLLLGFAVAAFVVWLVFAWRRRVTWMGRALALLPAIAWAALCLLRDRAAQGAAGRSTHSWEALWEGPATKLAESGRALVVASTSGRIEWLVILGAAIVAVVLLFGTRRSGVVETAGARRFLRSVALLAVVAYALLPYSIYDRDAVTHGVFILYSRFLCLAPLLFLPTLDWPRGRLHVGLGAAVLALLAMLAGHRLLLFRSASTEARGLDDAIAAIPPGKILKSLIYEPHPAGSRFEGFLHVGSYYQARTRGETDQSFALLPASPIHYRDPNHPYLSRADEHLHPQEFDDRRAMLYDAILVRDPSGQWMNTATAPWPVAFAANGWMVLRRP